MTTTLLALCKPASGPVVKRVVLSKEAQQAVGDHFNRQRVSFLEDVDDEVDFDGDWQPQDDQILSVDAPPEIGLMFDAAKLDATDIPSIDAVHFDEELIKALFIRQGGRLLIQAFATQQLLLNRHGFILDKETFKEMTQPAFVIAAHLTAIAEGGKLKFKSFPMMKRVVDLKLLYQIATNEQIITFCSHAKLDAADIESIKTAAGPALRKKIHAISQIGVLDKYSVPQLSKRAAALNIPLALKGKKLTVPTTRPELKTFLSFLEEKIYKGPLSRRVMIANSTREFKKN